MRVAIAFEFASLNGGEQSMLTALDWLRIHQPREWEFVGLAPPAGRLAAELQARRIAHVPLVLQGKSGNRLPPEAAAEILHDAVESVAPAVLHANSLSLARLTGMLAPVAAYASTGHLRDMLRLSRRATTDLAGNRLLLAVSGATAGYHIARGLPAERVRLLHNGVDSVRFQPAVPGSGIRQRIRQELGVPENACLGLTVGQIGLRKGLDVLAEAAVQLAEPLPELHLAIVGQRFSTKPESLQWEQAVRDRFDSAGLSARVHWTGWRDDMPQLMQAADLLIHAALQEPLGRVLLEAAAAGLPIVATSTGGTAEILRHGRSALLVPAGDAEALADAVQQVASDAALRQRLATAARKTVIDRFSVEQAARGLGEFWRAAGGPEGRSAIA